MLHKAFQNCLEGCGDAGKCVKKNYFDFLQLCGSGDAGDVALAENLVIPSKTIKSKKYIIKLSNFTFNPEAKDLHPTNLVDFKFDKCDKKQTFKLTSVWASFSLRGDGYYTKKYHHSHKCSPKIFTSIYFRK
jgi:hypothetical protein